MSDEVHDPRQTTGRGGAGAAPSEDNLDLLTTMREEARLG